MSRLKPCPFCGEELIVLHNQYYAHDLKKGEKPKCYGATWVFDIDDTEAIKRWNTRKPMDDVVKQLEDKKQFIATRAFCQQIPQEYCNDRNCFHCCVDYLINIVKAGEVDE